MTLGDRIKECRQKSHLSQEKVAELVGVSRQAVTKWEMNQSAPNTENLFRLAEIFGTTVDFLTVSETETKSLAEQIHQINKAEATVKTAERKQRIKRNLCIALAAAGSYLAIFLTGKLFALDLSEQTVVGWLFGTPPGVPSYLFAWLLKGMFLVSSLISILPALFGQRHFSITTVAGFAIALPLGELFGPHPEGAFYGTTHYGWAIWLLIFILSVIMGIILQILQKKNFTLRSKKFLFWCGAFLLGIIDCVVFVRLNMYP